MKKYITVKDLDRWGACGRGEGEQYSEENLLILSRGKKRLTVLEVLNLQIPDYDKLWIVLRKELIEESKLYELGHIFAKRVVRKYCMMCGIAKVEKWAKVYLESDILILQAARAARAAWAAWAARAARAAEAAWQVKQVKKILRGVKNGK